MGTHYYIQAKFGGGAGSYIYFGHTESHWLAAQFIYSLQKNKFLLENCGTADAAKEAITTFTFDGTTIGFCKEVERRFGVRITGEDIIDIFPTGIGSHNPIGEKMSVVSTMGNVVGGTFAEFTQKFLLPTDIVQMKKTIDWFVAILHLIRGDVASPNVVNMLVMFFDTLTRLRMLSDEEDKPPFLEDFSSVEGGFDIIRYGVWKGWFTPI